mmetsp:Transcript_19030/g.47632  ORF Transcript_19030/g.47632 Transcript_19030/m.47632 type:complete len:454 (+) Transcript_19030:149-1510(+)|eukprot:CAMPEP_0178991282 /NCGR_PEP_ID=MMETSP0795-20121207/5434_1 /TAXON_ID=88552 /ORGANISM="Amoebophrya sp., Strain Ameob2" /LENGTH=453 /DNA_ID=CAMNT_0020682959 /DNA_START=98 /DNA_END=1459 /DNA_ORIENTATION=+
MPSTACASTTAATPNATAADAGSKKRGRRDSTFPPTGLAADDSVNRPSSSKQTNAKKQKQEMNAASGSTSSSSGAAANAKTAAAKKKESLQLQCGQQQANLLPGGDEFEGDEQEESEDDVHPIALLPQLADQFQKSNGNAGKQGGTVKFTAADIKELRSHGFTTVDSLHFPPMRKLLLVRGISEQKAELLLKIGRSLNPLAFQSAAEHLSNVRQRLPRVSTGSSKLDGLLEGGVEAGSITELFGEFRSGKTQLVHTLCVMAQFPADQGGCEGKVCFIDTEGTFRPERLEQVAKRFKVSPADVLDNVVVCRAHNTEHQTQLLTEAAILMAQQKFGLLVVDSVTNLYRTEYSGRGELADRQQHLGRFLRYAQRIADEFQVAVVLTNQVCAKVDGSAAYGPSHCPIGGHVLAHACQTRLSLRKGKAEGRFCKIYDSPCLPEGEAPFVIGEGGVADE